MKNGCSVYLTTGGNGKYDVSRTLISSIVRSDVFPSSHFLLTQSKEPIPFLLWLTGARTASDEASRHYCLQGAPIQKQLPLS